MRCQSCNSNLNDFECTRKTLDGDYLDMCNKCIKGLNIKTQDRADLRRDEAAPADDWLDVGVPALLDDVSYFDED